MPSSVVKEWSVSLAGPDELTIGVNLRVGHIGAHRQSATERIRCRKQASKITIAKARLAGMRTIRCLASVEACTCYGIPKLGTVISELGFKAGRRINPLVSRAEYRGPAEQRARSIAVGEYPNNCVPVAIRVGTRFQQWRRISENESSDDENR